MAISLALHGMLVALGALWIFQTVPEPADRAHDFEPGIRSGAVKSHVRSSADRSAVPAPSRAAAAGVTGAATLPSPDFGASMPALGNIGGTVSGGGVFGAGPLIACFPDNDLSKVKTSIFELDLRAQRIAYVIDFSQSMRADGRDTLMRGELSQSVNALPDGVEYQIICFSGPAWVAGDTVSGNKVIHEGTEYAWTSRSLWEWAPDGPMMKAGWIGSTATQRRKTLAFIKETPLLGGTDWEAPLKMAMAMEPPPEEILFMTDGAMEGRDMHRLVRGLVAAAKSKNIRIHTVSMMVPQDDAVGAMHQLAAKTGGTFTIVGKDGRVRKGTARTR